LAPAADDEAGFFPATAAEPVEPAFDPVAPALAAVFADPDAVPAATAGLPGLASPAAVGEADCAPATPAPADPASVAVAVTPVGAVLSEPAPPLPGNCWFPALIPALFWPAAAAIRRCSLRRFPQPLAPAVITARRTATAICGRRFRLVDVVVDVMDSPLMVDTSLFESFNPAKASEMSIRYSSAGH
jgi:hypothetical protein